MNLDMLDFCLCIKKNNCFFHMLLSLNDFEILYMNVYISLRDCDRCN